MDINLFDFAASRGDKVADVSSVKQATAKKKPRGRPQEAFTDASGAPPSDRDPSSVRPAPDGSRQMNIDGAALEIQTASGRRSPRRAASLKEKLFKLVPAASQQNASPSAATSQPPSAEPAAKSENEGEEEEEEVQIRREGDDGSKSDGDAVASGGCDVEEVSLPGVTAARESQNSKLQFHADNCAT